MAVPMGTRLEKLRARRAWARMMLSHRFKDVVDAVLRSRANPPLLRRAAEIFGRSVSRFSKLFLDWTGISWGRFRRFARLQAAWQYCLSHVDGLRTAAENAGYRSARALARAIAEFFGRTWRDAPTCTKPRRAGWQAEPLPPIAKSQVLATEHAPEGGRKFGDSIRIAPAIAISIVSIVTTEAALDGPRTRAHDVLGAAELRLGAETRPEGLANRDRRGGRAAEPPRDRAGAPPQARPP